MGGDNTIIDTWSLKSSLNSYISKTFKLLSCCTQGLTVTNLLNLFLLFISLYFKFHVTLSFPKDTCKCPYQCTGKSPINCKKMYFVGHHPGGEVLELEAVVWHSCWCVCALVQITCYLDFFAGFLAFHACFHSSVYFYKQT